MKITNIRLVVSQDDGGIRQSERQYIPELKKNGINVIGVVLGNDLGNYADQKDDFQCSVRAGLGAYKGGVASRIKSLLRNSHKSSMIAKNIYIAIASLINSSSPGLVVVNVRRVYLIPVALKLARLTDGKVIYHSGGSFNSGPFCVNHVVYWFLRRKPNLLILANSQFSAKSYRLKSNRYVYPGVSTRRVSSENVNRDIRKELDIASDSPVFLYLARVNWDKAPDLLLKGFLDSEQATLACAHLIIAGPIQDDILKLQLDELIIKYEATERVHIVGKQTDVANWYACADVFVNSRRGAEPFGISIVEAMAAGLPVLSSALGGPSETVKEGINGWLVSELTEKGYQYSIDKVMLSREQWKIYSQRSIALSDSFSIERQTKRYMELFTCP